MISKIKSFSKKYPKTIWYKIKNNIASLSDQENALTNPRYAYEFALSVPGANIDKCQEVACQSPIHAYCFALNIPGANIEICKKAAILKDPTYAYYFSYHIYKS